MQDVYYILVLMGVIPFIFLFSKKNTIDRFIGELSYPTYLVHTTVFLAITNSPFQIVGNSSLTVVTMLLTIITSIGIVWYFERFIENWRQKRVNMWESNPRRAAIEH
jgi:peptidoglycan/LPS O-acetylase OafA/YrhL